MFLKESNRILLILFFLCMLLVGFVFLGFLTPLVIGILLASFTHPLYERLRASLRQKSNAAAFIIVAAIVVVVIIPFLGLATLIAREAFNLFLEHQGELAWDQPLAQAARGFFNRFDIDIAEVFETQISPTLETIGLFLTRQVGNIVSNAFLLTLDFFILILTVFYLLRDGRALGKFLMEISPLSDRDSLRVYRTFRETGRAVFYGNFVSAIAQGVLGGLGFFLFGLSSPIIWGTVMTFLALVPLLGAYLIFIPATLYLFLNGQTLMGIGFFIYNVLLVSTVDNIIKPKMISAKTRIHPLFAMLAIFGGIQAFGLLGIIYGPLIAAVFLVLFEIYKERVKPELTSTGQ